MADTLIGAGLGWLASEALDLGFSDSFLHQFASQLSPNSSALALAVEFDRLNEALQTLSHYRGKILHQTLPTEQARQTEVAMGGRQATLSCEYASAGRDDKRTGAARGLGG